MISSICLKIIWERGKWGVLDETYLAMSLMIVEATDGFVGIRYTSLSTFEINFP